MNVLLLLVLVLLYTFQSFFCRLYTDACKSSPQAATPVFNAIFGLVIGGTTLVMYGFHFAPSPVSWIFALFNAVMLLLYNLSLIGASRRGSYAFISISGLFGGILVPMLVSLVQWHERFSALQVAAIALMLIAFVIINKEGLSFKNGKRAYYAFCLLLFLSNGLFGAIMDAQQRVTGGAERGEMIVISYLGTTILSLSQLALTQKKEFFSSFKIGGKAFLLALGSGAVAVAAVNLMLYMLSRIPSTILYTIDNGGVLATSVLLSAVVLHEKIHKHQAVGILLALVSIVMLSL